MASENGIPVANGEVDGAPKGEQLIDKTATFKYGNRVFKIPFVKLGDSLTGEEDKELEDSIRAIGIIHPIVVDQNDVVLSGHNRLIKAHKIGMKLSQVPIVERKRDKSDEDKLEVVFAANFIGRRFTGERRAHACHVLRKLDMSAHRIGKMIGVHHTTVLDDLSKPDPLEKVEIDTSGGKDGAGVPEKGYVIGADGKKHPKRKKKKVKQVTATDIEEVEGDEPLTGRKKKAFVSLKRATIKACNMLMRGLDKLGTGEIHRDTLQSILDEVRQIQRPGVPAEAGT